jgi:hypothetical protein
MKKSWKSMLATSPGFTVTSWAVYPGELNDRKLALVMTGDSVVNREDAASIDVNVPFT